MAVTILIWAYSLATISLFGWLIQQAIGSILKIHSSTRLSFPMVCLLGMAGLTFYGTTLSLFMPLEKTAQIGIIVLSVVALILWYRQTRPFRHITQTLKSVKLPTLGLFLVAIVSILFLAIQTPGNYDSGLYHAQTIHWIETYSAVPGLANLHSRLGYNSSWFILQALYSFSFMSGNSYHLMTSIVFLLAIIYFCQGINRFFSGQRKASNWFALLSFPLILYMFSDQVSSPGNDAPIALIGWMIFSEWLCEWEDKNQSDELKMVVLSLICLYGVTIKLSAFPLLIISAWILIRYLLKRKVSTVVLVICVGTLLLIPWMARSVIQSGYVAYPTTVLDVFTFDWKIPKEIVQVEAKVIKNWARLPHNSTERIESLSFKAWVTEWFLNLSFNRRLIMLAVIILPCIYALTWIFPKIRPTLRLNFVPLLPVYGTILAGVVFWFYNAPDFRFGTTFIIPCLLILLIPAIQIVCERIPLARKILPVIAVFLVVGYQLFTFVHLIDMPVLEKYALYPANYPQLPSYPEKIGETTIWIPDEAAENQCWYNPFPCIPKANHDVELRGTQLQDGFRLK